MAPNTLPFAPCNVASRGPRLIFRDSLVFIRKTTNLKADANVCRPESRRKIDRCERKPTV